MLYLSRKVGESIIINNNIELKVIEVRGKTAKLGFDFPPESSILRKEIFDKVREENIAAATSNAQEETFDDSDLDLDGIDFE